MTTAQRQAVAAMAHTSTVLGICRNLCNGTKHSALNSLTSGTGARHHHTNVTIQPGGEPTDMDCFIDDGLGGLVSGRQLAGQCVLEWERILQSQGLPTARLS